MLVKDELKRLGLHYTDVQLGEAEILENITIDMHKQIKTALSVSGLELMDDRKSVLVQKVKNLIINIVHYSDEPLAVRLSDHLSQTLQFDYTYLANLFSEVQGITIEKFFIKHKIERVKELLVYNEFTLTQIAYQMHYSSVAHLSSQFKKVTGLTPSHFKRLKDKKRTMLEDIGMNTTSLSQAVSVNSTFNTYPSPG